jgi:hypothetical protein
MDTCADKLSEASWRLLDEGHEPSAVIASLLQGAALLTQEFGMWRRDEWIRLAASCYDQAERASRELDESPEPS